MNPDSLFLQPAGCAGRPKFLANSCVVPALIWFALLVAIPHSVLAASSSGIVVAAGKELTQTIDGAGVSVHLVSRPFFSPAPSSWPALEVGPATLTFTRDDKGGAMVLLGDEPLSLPFVISLDADGRSVSPIDLTLSYRRSTGAAALAIGDQVFTQPARPQDGAMAVVAAAGTEAPWTLDTFEVNAVAVANNAADAGSAPSSADSLPGSTITVPTSRASRLAVAQANAQRLIAAGTVDAAVDTLAQLDDAPQGSGRWHLEMARLLTDAAFDLTRTNTTTAADRAATAALRELELVRSMETPDPGIVARSHSLEGFLQERYWGDRAAAIAAYQSAADLTPQDGEIQRKLTRLKAIQSGSALQHP